MRLKRLEIAGFKSFRDKIAIDFSKGISAVVGPNGCGKSNIVDAIRWVMGEQRVKSLRGKKMDDVIFHGAENAAPVGMTEVSMIMDCNGRKFPGAYEECSEVMISRRLFREGESEYTINKVPCRLIDVRDFFMSTGTGVRTYSLVEQNSVASLVEAKPEDRRQFIEDAAGISKYKVRKESASRKMEATRQNIVRLNDIIREVKSQLNAVSRQAKRAEQYKTLKKEIKEAELTLALQTYTDISGQKEELGKMRDALAKRDLEVRTNLNELDASIEELKAEVLENETSVSEYQEKLYDIRNSINIKEQGIEHLKDKIKDIVSQKSKNTSEIEALRLRQENLSKELDTLSVLTVKSGKEIQNVRNSVLQNQSALEEHKTMGRSIQTELEEKKAEFIGIVTEKARLKNTLTGFTKVIEDIRKRKERDIRELNENKERLAAARANLDDLMSGLKADEETLYGLGDKANNVSHELEKAKYDLQVIEEDISGKKEQTGKKSSRLSSLRELQENYAWCSEGTKSIMKAGKVDSLDVLPGETFLGLVADVIDVPKDYETAVEAVLGEKLQYIVVKSQKDGVKAIDYLKSSSSGRGSFVPLEVRNHVAGAEAEHLKEAVRLIDMVDVHQGFEKIADYLLGDVLLIPNLRSGISLWERNGFRGTFVTWEGDIINPHGVLTGGSRTNGEKSLLRIKREIAELDEEVNRLNTLLEEETEKKKESASLILRWEEELLQLRAEIRDLELLVNGKRKDVERYESEIKGIEQRIKIIDFSCENLQSEEDSTLEEIEMIKEGIASSDDEEEKINHAISSLQEKWDALNVRAEEQEECLTKEKIHLASLEEKRNADLKAINRLDADRTDTIREIDIRIEELKNSEHEVEDITNQISTEQDLLESLSSDHEAIEETLSEIKRLQQERESLLRNRETDLREVKKALDEIVKEAGELEITYREFSFQMDSLKKGVEEKYYMDLQALVPEFQRLDEQAVQELNGKLEKDRKFVENFGEVNLLALSEYEQLKERFEFLTGQVSDLNASMDALQKTITKINIESRKRFAETFEAVNKCFQEVFGRIFPGGRGELRLTDSEDLLETGVDIDILIPGKRAQSISLLSGGEKSLAAIALIFAILIYRPVPFLVLDEVDAALDDANISLFNNLVKDISAGSQIIMVTHNKKTMEVAEYLFGITMQKQGISTMVSVALN
ncbi:MAG TPA: chromosome segregation protein SMC [Syntrophales bacterium]|nr:chromosome segregation protein SMC [Syntrophales bacterium]